MTMVPNNSCFRHNLAMSDSDQMPKAICAQIVVGKESVDDVSVEHGHF